MIFTSLQCVRNTLRYSYERTNLASRPNFAIMYLNYFYHSLLAGRLLNFVEPSIKPAFLLKSLKLSRKPLPILSEMYKADFFYFIGSDWCLIVFKVVEFTSLNPSVFRLKPLKKRSFWPKRSSVLRYSVVLSFD